MRLPYILLALCLLAPAVSAQAPAPQGWDAQFRAIPDAGEDRRVHAAHVRAAAPPRVAVRQGQRRVDRRPAEAVGVAGRDRGVPRADADAENAPARDDRAHQVRRLAGRTARRRRSDLEPAGRTAPVLQRVFGRRRRHRAPGVRQLRPPAGLRGARPAGRLGERRDRHRPLRRVVARHQAEGRRRARRHRVPHLLRSERRRVLRRGGVPGRPDAQQGRRAARQRDGHARASRRPADAQRRRHARRPAARREGRADDHEDPGAAHLLRRRAAAALGDHRAARARGLARRAADYLSHRPGRGDGPSVARLQLDGHAAVTTSSRGCRGPRSPTSGSCAATTTTRGSTAPRIR